MNRISFFPLPLLSSLALSSCDDEEPASSGGSPAGSGKLYVSCSGSDKLLRFGLATTVNGNVSPSRGLSGTNTALNTPKQFALNADEILVANSQGGTVPVWGAFSSASGNLAPTRSVGGSSTELSGAIPKGIAIDPTR